MNTAMANKLTTSKLVLKKQANANCAVLAVRELYRRGFIEQFGKMDRSIDNDDYENEQDGFFSSYFILTEHIDSISSLDFKLFFIPTVPIEFVREKEKKLALG